MFDFLKRKYTYFVFKLALKSLHKIEKLLLKVSDRLAYVRRRKKEYKEAFHIVEDRLEIIKNNLHELKKHTEEIL